MKTRSLLLHVPGIPFKLESLMPQLTLASVAGCLIRMGEDARILDFGTVEGMRGYARPGVRAALRLLYHGPSCGGGAPAFLPPGRRARQLLARARDTWAGWVTQSIVQSEGEPDLVVFGAEDAASFAASRLVSALLAKRWPRVPQAVVGQYAQEYGSLLLPVIPEFDAVCLCEPETSVAAFARRAGKRERWLETPNFMLRLGSKVVCSMQSGQPRLGPMAPPSYDRIHYPALQGHSKLLVFPMEHSRGNSLPGHGEPAPLGGGNGVRVKDAERLATEMCAMKRNLGAHTFMLRGRCTPWAQVDALACALLARDIQVSFGMETRPDVIVPGQVWPLVSAGCQAIDVLLETGSQRLLEDYHGRRWGVSQAEGCLKSFGEAGLHVAAQLCFPTAADDRHSLPETVRLLERTRPSGAIIRGMEVRPYTRWYNEAARFGLSMRKRPAAGILDAAGAGSFDRLADAPVPCFTMRGWSPALLRAARRNLLESVAECGIGQDVTAAAALIARAQGHPGGALRVQESLDEMLQTCNWPRLRDWLARTNRRLMRPASGGLAPFQPVLAAVGEN